MRRTARLVAALLSILVVTGAAAKFRPALRFTSLVDPVLQALADSESGFPAGSKELRSIENLYASMNHGSVSLAQDIGDVASILRKRTDRSGTDPAIESAARLVEPQAVNSIQSQLDYLTSWVAEIEQDNPAAHLSKTTKLIQKAKDSLDAADVKPTIVEQFYGLFDAANRAMVAESSIHLTTPPKSCKQRHLLKGEFCFANSTAGGLFRANAGQASFRKDSAGNVTGLEIYPYYCDGHDADLEYIHLRVLGAIPGTYTQDHVGGFKQGIGFELAMGAGSTVTITKFDIENQIVEGTFSFNASGLSGNVEVSGGSFRFEQIL